MWKIHVQNMEAQTHLAFARMSTYGDKIFWKKNSIFNAISLLYDCSKNQALTSVLLNKHDFFLNKQPLAVLLATIPYFYACTACWTHQLAEMWRRTRN